VGYLCANFIFLGLSVLDLGPMYATDRRQTDRCQKKAALSVHTYIRDGGIIISPGAIGGHGSRSSQNLLSPTWITVQNVALHQMLRVYTEKKKNGPPHLTPFGNKKWIN